MVRHELGLPHSNVGDDVLRALWKALDKEDTGLLAAGDFLQFMRLGDPTGGKMPSVQAMRREIGVRQRRAYEERQQKLQLARLDQLERDARAAERRAARLERELSHEIIGEAEAPSSLLPLIVDQRGAPDQARPAIEPAMRVRGSVESMPRQPAMSANYTKQLAEGQRRARVQATLSAYTTTGAQPYGTSSQVSSTTTASAAAKASRHMSGSISEGVLKLPAIKAGR